MMFPRHVQAAQTEQGFIAIVLFAIIVAAIIGAAGYGYYKHYHMPPAIAKLAGSCQPPELNVSIGPSSGTAGTTYVDAVFTNQGFRTCTLSGYPTISLADSHNTALGTPAIHNTAFPVTTVTLHPGESAHAAIGIPEPNNFSPGICSVSSTDLRTVAPNTLTPLETPLIDQYCPGFSVTVVRPGL